MIVFDLKCSPAGHVFEAWFGSSDDFEGQRRRELVSCPLCGSGKVDKAVMAPRVGAKGNQCLPEVGAPSETGCAEAGEVKRMLAAMAAVQTKILEQSEYVGDRFADEARAIHIGEADRRAIHGRATPLQTEALAAEGIAVAPLPFPVVEPAEKN